MITVLEGIRDATGYRKDVVFVAGCGLAGDADDGFDDAIEAARDADIAVLVVGEDWDMAGEAQCRSLNHKYHLMKRL